MAWVAVGTSVASIGLGILGGKKKAKAAKRAREEEAAFRKRELDLADEQFRWSKQIYEEDKAKFDPIFDEMRDSMDDVQPDYEGIAGDIKGSFASQRGQEERRQRRYGIRPDEGASAASAREMGVREAGAHVGARSAARRGVKETKYARRADLFNTGRGINSSNQAGVQSAMRGQQGANRSAAQASGANARGFDRDSAADSAGWGQAVGSFDWGGIFNEVKGWGQGGGGSGGGVTPGSRGA